MKIFLLKLLALALALAAGFLGWQTWHLRRDLHNAYDTVAQLDAENRELRRQTTTPPTEKPEQREDVRREIEQQTSELRGLSFKQPVTYKMITRAELQDVLLRKVREQYNEQELRDWGRSLEAFGLLPPGTELMKLFIGLYGEQVGAFYVPEERALYTFKDMSLSGGLDRMILAHELTHALQDQNYDLTKLPLHVKDNDDLALATSALLEGDATVLMTRYYAMNAMDGGMLGDLLAMMTGQKTEKLQAAPAFLREMMIFPYQEGQKLALALGGPEELNRALQQPPTSTEQVLHPEKYAPERDEPTPVTFAPLQVEGWRRIGDNVLGEFGVRAMLTTQLRFTEAQAAAAGWDGDRFHVYERGTGGPLAVVWRSVWDSEQDAQEFAEACERCAERRGVKTQVTRHGVNVLVVQSEAPAFLAVMKE